MHEGAALPVGEAVANVLAHGFDGLAQHFEDVEFVNDDDRLWKLFLQRLEVRSPHVDHGDLNPTLVGQMGEIMRDGRLFAVGQYLQHGVGFQIGQHAPRLSEQVQLIDPKHGRRLDTPRLLQFRDVIVEAIADYRG